MLGFRYILANTLVFDRIDFNRIVGINILVKGFESQLDTESPT